MSSILIVPIRPVDHAELASLAGPLEASFHLPAAIEERNYLDPSFALDSYRSQFNSTAIIVKLLERFPHFDGKILGITAVDLFVPVLTYVFGEAQLDGKAAVVSTFRLREEFFGLDADPKLERTRLLKEAIHELGHTFGLIHCRNYDCVMHSSTSVEEVDLKPTDFCEDCRKQFVHAD
ncbi:MAG TPA: archaemetzincin family Zn-dependent metalloprotease [Bacteroidota bacterium]|nr:archaemetzincin family Zn-dependent metalloprotease [Bacteroidota bacterium]